MSCRTPHELATVIQREAARPDRSAAVRASAGSGKTRVLIDRFVRSVRIQDPERFEALRGSSAIFLGNHRRALEVWDKARQNPTSEYFGDLGRRYRHVEYQCLSPWNAW